MQWEYRSEYVELGRTNFSGYIRDTGAFKDNDPTPGAEWGELDALGAEGWELVSVVPWPYPTSRDLVVAFFKRPMSPERRAELAAQEPRTWVYDLESGAR
jgi:hypothetical protein